MKSLSIKPVVLRPTEPTVQPSENAAGRTPGSRVPPVDLSEGARPRSLRAERPKLPKMDAPQSKDTPKVRGSSRPASVGGGEAVLLWWLVA